LNPLVERTRELFSEVQFAGFGSNPLQLAKKTEISDPDFASLSRSVHLMDPAVFCLLEQLAEGKSLLELYLGSACGQTLPSLQPKQATKRSQRNL
jgi:hypothetical protein